ncbi:hypothetical protein AX17_003922 [Amanita inopinata Kibby_2008]|nr:hypothetical protein AX17_003922 [Amanita inopinata Kibby_2008]
MGSCATFPTLTRTDAVTTQTPSTSISSSVSTVPPSTSVFTSVVSTCTTHGSFIDCVQSTGMVTSLISGSTTTVAVTQVTLVPVTSMVPTTLYSTSCTASNSQTSSSPSSTPSVFTPPPETYTSASSSTDTNGNVLVTQITQTLTFSPTTIDPTSTLVSDGLSHRGGSALAPIIGGAVGGFFGLIGIVALIWFIKKRRSRWDDIFEREDALYGPPIPQPLKRDPPPEPKPKPYEYGLVGHAKAPLPPHLSPPTSPGPNHGFNVSNSHPGRPAVLVSHRKQQNQAQAHERSRSSLTPLLSLSGSSVSGSSTGPASIAPPPSIVSSNVSGGLDAVYFQAPAPLPVGAAWVAPGIGRYPPGMPANMNAGASSQARQSFSHNDDEAYGGIEAEPAGASSASAAGSSANAYNPYLEQQPPLTPQRRDGKGRPVRTSGEKRPVVHLDGGRYVDSPHGPTQGSSTLPAPPAYEA